MRARPTIAIVAVSSALLIGSAAAPASAATVTVTTVGDLTTALADCSSAPNTIVIGADIVAASATLEVPCDTTIDLTTHDLTLRTINVGGGVELTVTGPIDGTEGLLTTNAAGTSQAAIRTTGATLRVTGGAIHATGGAYGTIGGDINSSGGTLLVEGGSVTAVSTAAYGSAIGGSNGGGSPGGNGGVVTITGGSVTASTNSPYGVAIGGGAGTPGGDGAVITVTGGVLTASGTGSGASTIGGGDMYGDSTGGAGSLTIGAGGKAIVTSGGGSDATVFGPGMAGSTVGAPGTIVVDGELHIPSGILRMPTGTSVTVGSTGRILGSDVAPTVGASFVGPATITNNGVIALAPATELVTGNNQLLTFSDASPSVRVFGPTLDAGYRALPVPPSGAAWNTAADGMGTWFAGTDSTAGSGTTALFAVSPGSVAVSTDPADLIAIAGEPFTFPVTVLDPSGAPVSPQPEITYTSSDCTFSALGVFETAGTCSMTASSVLESVTLSTNFNVSVEAGPAATLTLTPSAGSVTQGGTLTFTVTGMDAFGNPANTDAAVLTSSVDTDIVNDRAVTFPHASPHTITATLGQAAASVEVDVVPVPAPAAAVDSLSRTGSGVSTLVLSISAFTLLALGAGTLMVRRRFA